jgi:peptide subunit release factor 1 (eRF1)
MVSEVFAGLNAIKTAFDMAKGLKDIDDAARRNDAVIELQEKILSAQSAQPSLVETITDLKKRVAELETWETEKQRYELNEVATGVFAYRLKAQTTSTEPMHYLCARCYQHCRKSILQRRDRGSSKFFECSECNTELKVGDHFSGPLKIPTR